MQAARHNFFALGIFALLACFSRAEEVDRPPVDPQPDFVKPSQRSEPDAPSVTFDPTRNMKSRKDKANEARRAEKLAGNEIILERVRATLKDLGDAKITLYTLDSDDISTGDIDLKALDLANGVFFGVKIKQSFEVKADDVPLVLDLSTRSENYGEIGAGCFYPGMGVLWTSGEKRLAAVNCLYCSQVVFCWKDTTECVPLSNLGRVRGCELLKKYAPSDAVDQLLNRALEREKEPAKR